MVAHLGAASKFTGHHLDRYKNWHYVENSQFFYITVSIIFFNQIE